MFSPGQPWHLYRKSELGDTRRAHQHHREESDAIMTDNDTNDGRMNDWTRGGVWIRSICFSQDGGASVGVDDGKDGYGPRNVSAIFVATRLHYHTKAHISNRSIQEVTERR